MSEIMHIDVLAENLARAVKEAGHAVPKRGALPACERLHLSAAGGLLRVTATDLELAISAYAGARVSSGGTVTVPYKPFADAVKGLPPCVVTITGAGDGTTVTMVTPRGERTFNAMPAEDYPPVRHVLKPDVLFSAPQFAGAIRFVEKMAATEDSRPALTAVHMEPTEGGVCMSAADGFWAGVSHASYGGDDILPVEILPPARVMSIVAKLIGKGRKAADVASVAVNAQRTRATFRIDDWALVTTSLIQGTFPRIDSLYPEEVQTHLLLNTKAFAAAVKEAAAVAQHGSGIVRLHVRGDGKVTVSARAPEVGDIFIDVDADVTREGAGDADFIAFSGRHLRDALAVVGDTSVYMAIQSAEKPALFRSDRAEDIIIAPMRVHWDDDRPTGKDY